VAAFLIESYKLLKPDSGEVSARLLRQATEQLAAISNGIQLPPPPTTDGPFIPKRYSIHVNILWFLSLCLSLSCALAATLVQKWALRILRLTQKRGTPEHRVRIRAYLFRGAKDFRAHWVAENISLLLHAAIFLFFAGLVEFLFAVNDEVATVVLVAICILGAIYIFITALPVVFHRCPYQTPLTSFIWYTGHFLGIGALSLFVYFKSIRNTIMLLSDHIYSGFNDYVMKKAEKETENVKNIIKSALIRCGNDEELVTFFEALSGYLRSDSQSDHLTRVDNIRSLLETPKEHVKLGPQLAQLLNSCTNADGSMDRGVRRRRANACVRAVWEISRTFPSARQPVNLPLSACETLHRLSRDYDPAIALTTLSAVAMLERSLLDQLSALDEAKDSDSRRKTLEMLSTILGEPDPFSTRYQVNHAYIHAPDRRMIAATKFISSILEVIPRMENPTHEDLATTRDTLHALCYGLDREDTSISAQRSFAETLAGAVAKSAGTHWH
jgi:hypothetical protein